MSKILLLYDTQDEDLARDLKDFVTELGCEILLIPRSADLGKTLQGKEDAYFASAAGAIFLITPGSIRDGQLFPSPSVVDEMGRAREYYKSTPEMVTYLVQKGCQIQAVDQRSYIHFERENIRSVLSAITGLVRNLNAAGLLKAKLRQRDEMVWNDKMNAYFRSVPSGGKEGPFCPKCYDRRGKSVRMAKEYEDFRCTVCDHVLLLDDSPKSLQIAPPYTDPEY